MPITIFLRSLVFNVFFYVHTLVWMLVLLPTVFFPRSAMLAGIKRWAKTNRQALEIIAGVRTEFRGLDNIPPGGAIIASKHHSTYETVSMLDLFADPVYVMKKELLAIPLFGWYAKKAEQIPVDRAAGRTALVEMTRRAREEVARGRQLIIYPEGTRRPAGAERAYKHGVVNLYEALGVPVVPVALNAGLYWARHTFMRHPGTIVVEFLPPFQPGGDGEVFFADLQEAIETASDRLIAEAYAGPNPPPIPPGGEAWSARAPQV